jgi:DNA polymerase III subunit epsilon
MPLPVQRTFDDLGAPLFEVPFCVLDIETTGGSPSSLGITEIGAQRYRGGALEAEFGTLVNPGLPIPPFITVLTGITQAMVIEAPRLAEALPAFLEFLGDAVIVGHNVRYDLSFLDAAARHHGYGRLENKSVDTLGLARRLVGGDARNFKLVTLAAHFRSPVTPNHRALDDVRATAHVFWSLVEQAGTVGATHLEDLLRLPTARGRADYRKIELTDGLPRRPGVYLFRDRNDAIFYVGKAKNLRSRVRSYFYGDTRRSVERMLTELARVDHRVCETELEAEVTELRLIAAHTPRHNRRSKPAKAPHWVRLTDEAFPRLSLARSPSAKAITYLGPFRGRTAAVLIMEALWDALPVRRCTGRPGSKAGPCAFAQLGVAACPCDGRLTPDEYRSIVERLLVGLDRSPEVLLEPLAERMVGLARGERFEEAAWVRDRHRALLRSLERRGAWKAMQAAGSIHAVGHDGAAVIEQGRLSVAWADADRPPLHSLQPPAPGWPEVPTTVTDAAEADLLWRWLNRDDTVVIETTGADLGMAPTLPRLLRIAV